MHFYASYHHFRDIKFQVFDVENVGQGYSWVAVRWRLANSTKVIAHVFMLAPISEIEIIRLQMFDVKNLDQVHGLQHSQ